MTQFPAACTGSMTPTIRKFRIVRNTAGRDLVGAAPTIRNFRIVPAAVAGPMHLPWNCFNNWALQNKSVVKQYLTTAAGEPGRNYWNNPHSQPVVAKNGTTAADKLDKAIWANLKELGYG